MPVDRKKLRSFLKEMDKEDYKNFDENKSGKISMMGYLDHYIFLVNGSIKVLNKKKDSGFLLLEPKLKDMDDKKMKKTESLVELANNYHAYMERAIKINFSTYFLPKKFTIKKFKQMLDDIKDVLDPKKLSDVEKDMLDVMINFTGKYEEQQKVIRGK